MLIILELYYRHCKLLCILYNTNVSHKANFNQCRLFWISFTVIVSTITITSAYNPYIYINEPVTFRCSSNNSEGCSLYIAILGRFGLKSGCIYQADENIFTTRNDFSSIGFPNIDSSYCVAKNLTRPFQIEFTLPALPTFQDKLFKCIVANRHPIVVNSKERPIKRRHFKSMRNVIPL